MGVLEERNRAIVRRTKINKAVISVLAVAGVVALALVAPNVVGALGKVGLLPQRRQQAMKAMTRLIRAGYVAVDVQEGKKCARLTKKGEAFAASMHLGRVVPRVPRRWDGKWRVVVFDIPEKKKQTRVRIREVLRLFKFYLLQDSVWVYPYDCEDLIAMLKIDLKVGNAMLYMIVDSIENDLSLRRSFNLK